MIRLLLLALALTTALRAGEARVVRGTAHIDGALDEPFWSQAPAQSDFSVFQTGTPAADTTFKLAHDDAWLYIGFECRHKTLKLLQPIVKGHDRGAMKDESVEVFLAPRVTEPAYFYHYALGFGGARDERIVTGTNVKEYWNVPWRSATRRSDEGWTAELAVPLSLLRSGGGFQDLRINVARNRRVPEIDSQNVVINESRESSSWSPVKTSFHEQAAFRPVTGFPAEMEIRQPQLVSIEKVRAETSGVRAALQNHGASDATVRVVMGAARSEALTLKPKEVIETRLAIIEPDPANAELRVLDAATDEVLATEWIEDTDAWRPLTAFLDRNYYTSETEAVIHFRINQTPPLKLVALSADGQEVASVSPAAASGQFKVPLSDRIVLQLRRDDRVLGELILPVRRLPPQPGAEWKIDQERRLVLNNGRPFVPFGMLMSGVRDDDEAAFKKLADHGFNTFVVWNHTTPQGMANYQRLAARHGLTLITNPDECTEPITWDVHARYDGDLLRQVRRVTDTQNLNQLKNVMALPISIPARDAIYGEFFHKNIDRMIAGVESVKRAPNVAAHFIMDEPMANEAFHHVKFGQEYFARVRRADGYHPVIVNYSSFIPAGDDYTKWCDVLMTDPYWYPPATDNPRTTPNHVSKITWMTDQRAQVLRQANWQTLAGPRWSRCFKRPLHRDEIRCQTYLALIHKATGLFYFSYAGARAADWNTFRDLGTEMRVLTPFMTGPEVKHQITYQTVALDEPTSPPSFVTTLFDPTTEKYPHVQSTILSDADGKLMLLAANSRHFPVTCRFEIARLAHAESAFGNHEIAVQDRAFTDTLPPYATRAWRLKLDSPAQLMRIQIQQTALKYDMAKLEPNLPGGWRPGRRNVMPNPSFEDITVEGSPDYCLLTAGVTPQAGGTPFGKHCIRIEKTGTTGYEALLLRCDPQDAKPQTYTLSIHLKASREGLPVWIRGQQMNREKPNGENSELKLTTSWQRYSITGIIPAQVSEALYEVRLREPGTLWVDAVQLERGETASAFEK